jgi:branched-chain amino acid transport system ATP-binding protein
LEEIRKKDGTSILLVEQNALKSLKVSDRGYVLVTGKKIFEGDAKNILENKDIGKLYLGIKK